MDAHAHAIVTLCLACLFFCCIIYCTFMHSDSSIVASHIGTLDVQHVNVKDVLLEPNPKMVNGGLIQKMEGLSCSACLDWR